MEKKALAEFIGTAVLVLFGCGSAVIGGGFLAAQGVPGSLAVLSISLSFGLAIVAMAYGIGPISGCHVNPAVSVAALAAGRMTPVDCVVYVVAQCLGAIVGAGILLYIASGTPSYELAANGLGQNGWGPGYLGEYTAVSAFWFEAVATFIFVVVILGATQAKAPAQFAGLAIGLTLAVIHIVGIPITGVSVNPARSLGPAALVGGEAMAKMWLFISAPLIGAIAAGLLFRQKILEA